MRADPVGGIRTFFGFGGEGGFGVGVWELSLARCRRAGVEYENYRKGVQPQSGMNRLFTSTALRILRFSVVCLSSAIGLTLIASPPSKANVAASMACSDAGRMVIRPIYVGRSYSGSPMYVCRDSGGIDIYGPPYPLVVCFNIIECRVVNWVY